MELCLAPGLSLSAVATNATHTSQQQAEQLETAKKNGAGRLPPGGGGGGGGGAQRLRPKQRRLHEMPG
jgi:hypothetical protein